MVTKDVFRDIMFVLFIIMFTFVNNEVVAVCRGSGRGRNRFIGNVIGAVILLILVVVACLGFVASCFVVVY